MKTHINKLVKGIFRNNFEVLLVASLTLLFTSCEEVIDVDLKEATPQIVIEANLSDVYGRQYVKVTETVPFKNESAIKNVSGAAVTITADDGEVLNFSEEMPGLYVSQPFGGSIGATYRLKVTVNGKSYEAVGTMPEKVPLDSVSITEVSFFDETSKYVKAHYQDPPQEGNAYRFLVKNNGVYYKGFYVTDDRFSNGRYNNDVIFTDDPEIEEGDEIELEFQTINLDVYRYFYAISQISGGGGPPVAGGNPESKISNGALGYFSVHTSQKVNFRVVQ
ncbi:DUF4249 domain-containing protein [Pseudoxanthomonas sp. SGD-10]|nr:DUF4249 domain-containing protein [Pseudoxanthomonas sp. SGD-10]